MSWLRHLTRFENRLLDRARSPAASRAALEPATGRIEDFVGQRHCVLVSYRRDGTAVPSPLWFATADAKLYVHTGGAKVKRIAANHRVRVAPSTFRGRPLKPPLEATARVLNSDERGFAEQALRANYGIGRQLYYRLFAQIELGDYVELTPQRSEAD